jgi:hypothetical protein
VLGQKKILILQDPFVLNVETGNYSLIGRLVDAHSKAPISEAYVRIRDGGDSYWALPDTEGRFVLSHLSEPESKINIRARGYYYLNMTRKLKTCLPGKVKETIVPVGGKGGSLMLILQGEWKASHSDLSNAKVRIGEHGFPLDLGRYFLQEGDWTYLMHGIPSGKQGIKITNWVNGVPYRGETEVELKEGEIVEARVLLK